MKATHRSASVRISTLLLLAVIAAGTAPATGSIVAGERELFRPGLTSTVVPAAAEKVVTQQERPASIDKVSTKAKIKIETRAKVVNPSATASTAPARVRSAATDSTIAADSTIPVKASNASDGTSNITRARAILAGLIARYPILKGTTVQFGDARGYQAIVYYKSGRIIISPNHTASLERILNHEIWHIIDWRDNGRIDWGERVPPPNASSFAK